MRDELHGHDILQSRFKRRNFKVIAIKNTDFVFRCINIVDMFKKHKNNFILHSQGVGKFGRCLGEIFFGDEKLNDLLITEGHAVKYYGGKR